MKTLLGLNAQRWETLQHFFLTTGLVQLGIGILCIALVLLQARHTSLPKFNLLLKITANNNQKQVARKIPLRKGQVFLLIAGIALLLIGCVMILEVFRINNPIIWSPLFHTHSLITGMLSSILLIFLGYRIGKYTPLALYWWDTFLDAEMQQERHIQWGLCLCCIVSLLMFYFFNQ